MTLTLIVVGAIYPSQQPGQCFSRGIKEETKTERETGRLKMILVPVQEMFEKAFKRSDISAATTLPATLR